MHWLGVQDKQNSFQVAEKLQLVPQLEQCLLDGQLCILAVHTQIVGEVEY